MADSIIPVELETVSGAQRHHRQDQVAVEEPLEIRLRCFDGSQMVERSIAITMRTPGHDEELACGFLLGEGVIAHAAQIQSCRHSGTTALQGRASNVVKITLAPDVRVELDRLERHFYTSSSCGVCGKASLEALDVAGAKPIADNGFTIHASALHQLAELIGADQLNFQITGGLHAAAVFDNQGNAGTLREDVGRHNAFDKLTGNLLRGDQLPAIEQGVYVSGRASFELAQKAVMAGVPLLAAVGAPSSLAVELAREYNMTLVGFMRDNRFNIYHGGWRIL
jgi:FdhD protein